jgi:hypothetical protein
MYSAWLRFSFVFVVLGVASVVATEITRSVVHKRRERIEGIGGTQDIAIWGMLVLGVCIAGATICGVVALRYR